MLQHNFNKERELEFEHAGGLVRIVSDLDSIQHRTSSDRERYVYSPGPAILTLGVDAGEYIVPPRSVTRISAGMDHVFKFGDSDLPGYVFDVHGMPNIEYGGLDTSVTWNEGNNLISSIEGGRVVIYTDDSRILPFNLKKSGWFTHRHKGCTLGISDAVWERVREAEVQHYHRKIQETYVVLQGAATIDVGGEDIVLGAGEFLLIEPEAAGKYEPHRVSSIQLDARSGLYHHVCCNFPSLPGESEERVVLK